MPFAASFDGIWSHVIKPAIAAESDSCRRADDFFTVGAVIHDVLKRIDDADYVLADLTGRNPNVFFEVGYARARSKPTILIAQDIDDVPFDLRDQRVLVYKDTAAGADELRTAIRNTVRTL